MEIYLFTFEQGLPYHTLIWHSIVSQYRQEYQYRDTGLLVMVTGTKLEVEEGNYSILFVREDKMFPQYIYTLIPHAFVGETETGFFVRAFKIRLDKEFGERLGGDIIQGVEVASDKKYDFTKEQVKKLLGG